MIVIALRLSQTKAPAKPRQPPTVVIHPGNPVMTVDPARTTKTDAQTNSDGREMRKTLQNKKK